MLLLAAPETLSPLSLDAVLFSCDGRAAVRVTALLGDRATVCGAVRPHPGSFAFLVRNGVKLAATVAWGQGDRLGLCLEEPLPDGDRRDAAFRERRAARRRSH